MGTKLTGGCAQDQQLAGGGVKAAGLGRGRR